MSEPICATIPLQRVSGWAQHGDNDFKWLTANHLDITGEDSCHQAAAAQDGLQQLDHQRVFAARAISDIISMTRCMRWIKKNGKMREL